MAPRSEDHVTACGASGSQNQVELCVCTPATFIQAFYRAVGLHACAKLKYSSLLFIFSYGARIRLARISAR